MRPCSRSGKFSLETMILGRSTPWKAPFPGKIERSPGRSAVQNAVCCAILDMSFELPGGGRACGDQSVRGRPPHIPHGFLVGANRDLSCAADIHTRRAYFAKSECGQARMGVAAPACLFVTAIAARQALSYSGRGSEQEYSESRAPPTSEDLRRYVTAGSNVTSSPPKKT
jgi:hypothetical protein